MTQTHHVALVNEPPDYRIYVKGVLVFGADRDTPGHVCQCMEHWTEKFEPPRECQGDGHVAVRFGKNNESTRLKNMTTKVYLDGKEISQCVFEAMAGDPGWVMVYTVGANGPNDLGSVQPRFFRGHRAKCCENHTCAALLRGKVEVRQDTHIIDQIVDNMGERL